MLLVDAHVHIHDCFDLDAFFDAAYVNFRSAAEQAGAKNAAAFLLLAEDAKQHRFRKLSAKGNIARYWRTLPTGEAISLRLVREERAGLEMVLVAGRQIVTAEKLEVLALLSGDTFEGGKPLAETVSAVRRAGGLPVLPWGVGKWLGRRGRILETFFRDTAHPIFWGDNGGRPIFWPPPRLFRLVEEGETWILPGSDPLPLPSEYRRVGTFGLLIETELSVQEAPGAALKRILLAGVPARRYGSCEALIPFCRKQLALRTGFGKKKLITSDGSIPLAG